MVNPVERAIETMWEHYHEPISLADLAAAANLSRFYFARVFRASTGTSPGRFLAAIRLSRAKQLLLESSLSITAISYRIGYNSVGTFTSRFTASVGMSPTRYRWRSRSHAGIGPLTAAAPPQGAGRRRNRVVGTVCLPPCETPVRVYVAAFDGAVAEGLPSSCDILDGERTQFELSALPDGEWFIRAAAVGLRGPVAGPWRRQPLFVDGQQIAAGPDARVIQLALDLHPTGVLDLPILTALPELDCRHPPSLIEATG
ncbi:helix-turn-helix transcriptional regulator [Actinospica durhamensis]|uniref:Helix-turn-helix transcriptional regulator n=1 Tax=Actinospica durhamensis TaxID=1508375 RepID=A0A941EMY1_9ACTN|nr:helix-turn-helix transcriptional regulator [Actinospica durhamensis]MBR7831984.1 helix-turn-helix transcriptional regulator [Actinospica durhamensis]